MQQPEHLIMALFLTQQVRGVRPSELTAGSFGQQEVLREPLPKRQQVRMVRRSGGREQQ
jgi:hypothetical protein